jgi:hypothetical protein
VKITIEFDSQEEHNEYVFEQERMLKRALQERLIADLLDPMPEMVEPVVPMSQDFDPDNGPHAPAVGIVSPVIAHVQPETVSEAVDRVIPEVLAQGAEIAALKGNTRRRRCKECNELFPTPNLSHVMCAGCTVATAPEPEQEPRPELTVVAAPPSEVSIDKVRAAFAAVVAKNYNTAADILTDLGAGTFDEVVAAGNVEQLAAALVG